jgi:hypothetical protein
MPSSSLRVDSVSLAELFEGTSNAIDNSMVKGKLTLPEYQRPYRWSASQVAELANDLAHHFTEPTGHDYYLGSLILHRSTDACLNIIDGQQRITSVGILSLLAGVRPLPKLGYAAPESQQRILANLLTLRQRELPLAWLTPEVLAKINVTLVVTDSEDDAYRFFETQNSGGVRLSGIDVAKAYHLRVIADEQQDTYAKIWEAMGDLRPVVDAAMRGRFWQSLDWRDLASSLRQPNHWRDQVVAELAEATGDEGKDLVYHLAVTAHNGSFTTHADRNYDLRQPLDAGPNSIRYLQQFQDLLSRYCPNKLTEQEQAQESNSWRKLYNKLVAQSDASDHLRKLYDSALVLYLSRFGDAELEEAGLWIFRAVYSLRLSNDKMVKEASVQRFVRDTPVLDWIAHSYTHKQLVCRLRELVCKVSVQNLTKIGGKKRCHIAAVCEALGFWQGDIDISPALIAERFDITLCQVIQKRLTSRSPAA